MQGEGVVVELVLISDCCHLGLGGIGGYVRCNAGVSWWSIPRCASESLVLIGTNGESEVALKSSSKGAGD